MLRVLKRRLGCTRVAYVNEDPHAAPVIRRIAELISGPPPLMQLSIHIDDGVGFTFGAFSTARYSAISSADFDTVSATGAAQPLSDVKAVC